MSTLQELDEQLDHLWSMYTAGEINRKYFDRRKDEALEMARIELEFNSAAVRAENERLRDRPFQFKASRDGTLVIRASTWETAPDTYGTVMGHKSCVNARSFRGPLYYNHIYDQEPLAWGLGAEQTDSGLIVRAKWAKTPFARDTRTIIRERAQGIGGQPGKLTYASIGLDPSTASTRCAWIDRRPVEVIDKWRLREVSLCMRPANRFACVISA